MKFKVKGDSLVSEPTKLDYKTKFIKLLLEKKIETYFWKKKLWKTKIEHKEKNFNQYENVGNKSQLC